LHGARWSTLLGTHRGNRVVDPRLDGGEDAGERLPATPLGVDGQPILGLVAAGVGASVLASSYAARSGEDTVFVPITDSQTTLYLAWRGDDPSTARDNLIAVARRVARGDPGIRRRGG
jgi:DNA-binding transcriptional LysR family regulator